MTPEAAKRILDFASEAVAAGTAQRDGTGSHATADQAWRALCTEVYQQVDWPEATP